MWFISKDACCGCGVCEIVCKHHSITLTSNEEGFLYPVLDEKLCTHCTLCEKTCPILNVTTIQLPEHDTAVYAGYLKDPDKLSQSASGGIATALSEHILDNGGVVAGVKYTNNFRTAEYVLITTHEEFLECKRSKYIQAVKGTVYSDVRDALEQNLLVLFVGLPCEVGALKTYLRKDHDNLYTCELICHGPTSELVAHEYLEMLEKRYQSTITEFTVRYKKEGAWTPAYLYAKFANGKNYLKPFYDTEYGYAFSHLSRPSCSRCVYKGRNTVSDLTIGDYWGCSSKDPFWNEHGVSVIFVHTIKGQALLRQLKNFTLYQTTLEQASAGNPLKYKSKQPSPRRQAFSIYLQENGLRYAYLHTTSVSFRLKKIFISCIYTHVFRVCVRLCYYLKRRIC